MGSIVPSVAFGHGMPCPYCRGLNGIYPAQSCGGRSVAKAAAKGVGDGTTKVVL
jgi:hypothetical protein